MAIVDVAISFAISSNSKFSLEKDEDIVGKGWMKQYPPCEKPGFLFILRWWWEFW